MKYYFKQNIFISALVLLLTLFVSCKKEHNVEGNIPTTTTDSIMISEAKVLLDTAYSSTATLENYVETLQYNVDACKETCKNQSPEKNNETYENYFAVREALIKNLNQTYSDVLEKYASYYNFDTGKTNLPTEVQNIANSLQTVDVEFWDVGEGYTEIRSKANHYYNIFKNKLTPDYEAYLKQTSKEKEVLYAADAGLNVSFDEVGSRAIFWENFIKKYPNSKLIAQAEEDFNWYLNDFLFGLDNTPTFEDGKIYDDVQKVYQNFMKKYPNSIVSEKIKLLYHELESNAFNDTENIRENLGIEYPTYD